MKKLCMSICVLAALCTTLAGCANAEGAKKDTVSAAPKTRAEAAETDSENTEIQVFIAASLSGAMNDVAVAYNKDHPGVKITYNADSSGTLMQQIEEGFECDLFFSAATSQMDELKEKGFVKGNSITSILENEVVLITPKKSGTKVTGFKNMTEASNIALAGESVPVGKYSRQIFENLGIYDDVMTMPINECKNVSAVKEAVKEGSNEIGTVYYSDAYSVKDDVDIIEHADSSLLDSPIIYPAALIQNEQADMLQSQAAEDFLAFLSSDTAKKIFTDYMFVIYED